jgi:threonine/homoserine/homoserine lactone efflux protein
MTTIFKTFLAATALALTLGLTTATVSAPAMADGFDTCCATPSGTC